MDKEKKDEGVALSKWAKDILLCFDKKYERRVMAHLYKKGSKARFKELMVNCTDNILHSKPLSRACNRLKDLGIITSDNGRGRNGSNYEINKTRYIFLVDLVNQLNQLENGSEK